MARTEATPLRGAGSAGIPGGSAPRRLRRAVARRAPGWLRLVVRARRFPEPEIRELDWLVARGTLAVDVGANQGAYTYRLARLVGRGGGVLAVEPMEALAAELRGACARLRLPVRVERCALSAREGEAELFVPVAADGTVLTGFATIDGAAGGAGRVERVPVRRLDELLGGRTLRVSFIKCDVEGHEMEVFRGAAAVLSRDRPNLLVEIEQRHFPEPIGERFAFFRGQGYAGYFLDGAGALRPVEEFDAMLHQAGGVAGGAGEGAYVNNFIFLPAEGVERALTGRERRGRRAR
ncbi:MAG TPA: FkbM family methyltransferase [Longimicrobiales bacterium]